MSVKWWLYASAVILCVAGTSTRSSAQSEIGAAERVVNVVEGDQGGTTRQLGVNSGVFQDESISTRGASATSLRFEDQTTLSMGANSRVKLDRFVYDANRGAGEIVFNAARGAFRFVTGAAQSSSYRFVTPTANVGVRGTDLDLYVNRLGDTFILGRSGRIIACPRTESEISPDNTSCCDIEIEDPAQAKYGIILRRNFNCRGPHLWQGQDPFTQLTRARRNEIDDEKPEPEPEEEKASEPVLDKPETQDESYEIE